MKKTLLLCTISLTTLLTACEKSPPNNVNSIPTPIAATKEPKSATPDDWNKAISEAFWTINPKSNNEGITEFFACFAKKDEKCAETPVFVKQDIFRKTRFFISGINSHLKINTFLGSYVALHDNEKPKAIFSPYFFSKGGWIFLKQISILADGELIFDENFTTGSVDRNNYDHGVEESGILILKDPQINALRKIKQDSNVIIRFTGDKGYTTLKKQDIKYFKEETQTLLKTYDLLNAALEGNIPN